MTTIACRRRRGCSPADAAFYLRTLFWATAFAAALLLPLARPALAADPVKIEARPALGDALVQGRWQSVLVTLTNPDAGEAIQGEAQVILEETRSGARIGAYSRAVSLPRGAGVAQVPVSIYVPGNVTADLRVQVARARDGALLASRRFDKIPFLPEQLTLLAVGTQPDALDYLRGERIGVYRADGALRKFVRYTNKNNPPSPGSPRDKAPSVRITYAAETGALPDRALGYEAVGIVYLGDVSPDAFSDGQAAALRGWVASGGLLVLGGGGSAAARLSQDHRFASWVPSATKTPVRHGRGTALLGAGSLEEMPSSAAAGYPADPARTAQWRSIALSGIAPRSVGSDLAHSDRNGGYYPSLAASVLRAPGLRAPSSLGVGLFLTVYLALLAPVNYIVLKKLDRREWTWLTVPALVLLFTVGAYGFGYSSKGTRMRQNVAAVVEMGEGSGEASVTASIGIFSPRRAAYDVQALLPDALLYDPADTSSGTREYTPLTIREGEGGSVGATAKGAEISMWAMRSFGVRASATLGKGVAADLRLRDGQITGTITNRTERVLENASFMVSGGHQILGTIPPGQSKTIAIPVVRANGFSAWHSLLSGSTAAAYSPPPARSDVDAAMLLRQRLTGDLAGMSGQFLNRRGADRLPGEAVLSAWTHDTIVPVRVAGSETAPVTQNVSLVLAHLTVKE